MLNWDASDLYLGLLEWMGGYHEWKHGRVRSHSIVHVHLAALLHAWVQDHQILHRISEEIFVFPPAFPQLFHDSIRLLLLPLFAYAVHISDTLYSGTPLRNLLANIIGEGELVLSIALLVYATAPVTGGHMNPMVTTATFLARLTAVPRAMLYIISQVIGAAIGAWLIRSSYGSKLPPEVGVSSFMSQSPFRREQREFTETQPLGFWRLLCRSNTRHPCSGLCFRDDGLGSCALSPFRYGGSIPTRSTVTAPLTASFSLHAHSVWSRS